MLLFDVDNFKSINDTYGHEVGDKVLVKLVQILNNNFRSDDYICRVGGDEFVVFMVHAAKTQRNLIVNKIETVLEKLADPVDGLPRTSVSVGVAHGSDAADPENLFNLADKAMYLAKRNGKRGYAFYKK
jgi:diguanylate cyclase (GGDEF)-like protein